MIHPFEISCKECGAHGFLDSENNGAIKVYFEKGSPSILDSIIICCSKCGGKQEPGIYWPLDSNAILTSAMHSAGEADAVDRFNHYLDSDPRLDGETI